MLAEDNESSIKSPGMPAPPEALGSVLAGSVPTGGVEG